jgi:DNA polymerase (family 10)
MNLINDRFSNQQIADVLMTIANLLEIKGEVIYKILAYRKAAESITTLGRDVHDIWQDGELTEIPGVGKAIADKIDELLRTGKLEFFERLKKEVPISLAELLLVPDLGPKKVAMFWKELGIINISQLEEAARTGKLRDLPGMGEKSEAKVLAGIQSLSRRTTRIPLGSAYPFAIELIALLRKIQGVEAVEMGGSLRRMRATVGDIDLLAAATDSRKIMSAFSKHPQVVSVLSQGVTKASVEYRNGLRAQLWVHPPDRFGTALQYATGSKDHNIRLRELALKQGLSLSEHALIREDGSEILCGSEEEVYAVLGLPWIPPELREDRGEVQAAMDGKLPKLIVHSDMRADLQTHSTWSDGVLSIKEMAEEAKGRGISVLAITDHSGSLGVAGGLSVDRLTQQWEEIDTVQQELGDSIMILKGTEVEIRADGSLDYPDEVLAKLDIVVASLHSSLRQPRDKITQRLINAIRNPHVDVIGHPTGRMIPDREGADLDMDAVLKAAAEHKVAMEINAHPSRLDLDDIYARRAVGLGVLLSINTDAHSAEDMDMMHFGIATARRGWVEAEDVINTWSTAHLRKWLKDRNG